MKLILASSSPRRRELLQSLGVPFEVVSPSFQESSTSLPAPEEALYFALQKAQSVERLFSSAPSAPSAMILASDTLIECAGEKLGKPKDQEDAIRILKKLSGKTHRLYTAVVLLNSKEGGMKKHVAEVTVTFRSLSDQEIRDYVATGEPMGKAGAYAIQGRGRGFITEVKGDEQAAIGLPLGPIREWLSQ